MRKLTVALLLLATILLSIQPLAAEEAKAIAQLVNPNGANVGELHLIQEGDMVHIVGEVSNLPPGPHGLHIHAVGSCTPDFSAAGGHFNPFNRQHGLWNPQGPHAGDLANLMVAEDGTGTYDYKTSNVTLRSGPTSLFDQDGSAIVIHANPDDYVTDPTGGSGDRIACGVIQLVQAPAATPLPLPGAGVAEQPAGQPGAGGSDRPGSLPVTNTPSTTNPLPLLLLAIAALTLGVALVRKGYARR